MPAILTPAYSAAQFTRAFVSRRKLLIISSHTRRLTGNALGLALAAQSSPDFLPIFLGKRSASLRFEIPTWRKKARIASLLLKRADVIAYTGYCPDGLASSSSNMLRVFLWHGMPIKGIGGFDPFTTDRGSEPCDLAIATAERTAEIMAQSFGIAPEKFAISGEPKTDYLPTNRPGWDWSVSLREQYRTLIGYFPTWREKFDEIDGRRRRRGDDAALAQLVTQLTCDASLRNLLERHKAAFVVRMHVAHEEAPTLSPPFFLMKEAQGDATHLLQECDVVVGDYSSVVIDALLFDRPLALWCEDLESYISGRPLPYFDFHDTFGWAIKATLPELRDWIGARLQSHPLSQAEAHGFAHSRAVFHQHVRGGAGERVLEAIRARLKNPCFA
jgi:CDP-glycerol glycerophosphotransferase (TagB/SpsB family)